METLANCFDLLYHTCVNQLDNLREPHINESLHSLETYYTNRHCTINGFIL